METVLFFYPTPFKSCKAELNRQHLHLFNGANVFARRRLAAENGFKFGFVVKPKKIKFTGEELEALQGVILMKINQVLAPYATWM